MAFPAALPLATLGSTPSNLPIVTAGVPVSSGPLLAISVVTKAVNGVTPVTVVAPQVTANSAIIPFLLTVGGTVGAIPAVQTITAGTGFTFLGTASDTSTYGFLVIG
jgi:hypothetical protein